MNSRFFQESFNFWLLVIVCARPEMLGSPKIELAFLKVSGSEFAEN
jgi:hypothetical protein